MNTTAQVSVFKRATATEALDANFAAQQQTQQKLWEDRRSHDQTKAYIAELTEAVLAKAEEPSAREVTLEDLERQGVEFFAALQENGAPNLWNVEEGIKYDPAPVSAWAGQVDGNHYSKLPIQPFKYSMDNHLDPMQHTIIKYVTRFRDKGGIRDLRAAIHTLELLIEWECANPSTMPQESGL